MELIDNNNYYQNRLNMKRITKQRENIKNGLKAFCTHPTAEELYLTLKVDNPNLSLATVYRTLNKLAELGEIKKIEGLSGQIHYDDNNEEHFHIICQRCSKIKDLSPDIAESLKKALKNQKEFEIISYDILVKGICKKCKDKGETDGI